MNSLLEKSLIVVLLLLAGCRHDYGAYSWVDDFKDPTLEGEYVIRPGDRINVRVFQQEPMSAQPRVRADGKISLPFLHDVVAAGFTPDVLGAQLQTRLKDYINNPVVTVSIEEVRQVTVSVLGEVAHPGIYNLEVGAGVLQALAAAGGFTNFSNKDIFVLRPASGSDEKPARIRFDYDSTARAEGKGAGFRLKPGDSLIVE